MTETVVLFEGIQEFKEDIIFSLFAGLNVWVEFGIVSLLDVIKIEDSTLILVHDGESLLAKVNSELVHFTSDTSQEFFVVNSS